MTPPWPTLSCFFGKQNLLSFLENPQCKGSTLPGTWAGLVLLVFESLTTLSLSVLQWDYIPGLDVPVSETGEKDSPASSPVHRPTRKARGTTPSAAKPDPGPETITVSDDSGDEAKAKKHGSEDQHNE